jgi:nucleotide-binding universal stress UspA family protein
MKILIAYDGTLHAKKALRYGIEKISAAGGEMTVLQVFDRSQFAEYGQRAEELARTEASQQLEEARSIIAASGSADRVRVIAEEGDAFETIAGRVDAELPSLVLLPPRFQSLASKLSCPVTVVPGTVLVPVDRTGSTVESIDRIVREATATGSRVLLLGIVPVHLYNKEEKKELERVKKETAVALKKLKNSLEARSIDVRELSRSGYPDEEILKAAGEFAVSLILLPSGSTTPSELSKAAAILLDDSDKLKWPVFLLPPASA